MDFITNIETEINSFIDQINSFIFLAKGYVIFTSIVLVIILAIVGTIASKQSHLEAKIDRLINDIACQDFKGDPREKEIRELMILSKSNSPYQAKKAKEELERIMNNKGDIGNGINDERSDEGDNGRS